MTRLSSFYFYLVDLWRRCFGMEYWLEAEKTKDMKAGDEVATHNFRACSKCGKYINSLDVTKEEERCEHKHNGKKCGAILHRKGIYIDAQGRKFVLQKSLHLKLFAVLQCLSVAGIVINISVFRVKIAPAEYEASDPIVLLWILWATWSIWVPYFLYVLFASISSNSGNKNAKLVGLGIFLVFGMLPFFLVILSTTSLSGYIVVPFWEDIPIQEQIYDQQYDILKAMPLDYKRFSFAQEIAQNPRVNLSKEFVQIAKEDFVELVKVYSSRVFYLGYGSPEMQEFYGLYQNYLESLETEDLIYQCQFDPWNLASGLAVQTYPETWEVCFNK